MKPILITIAFIGSCFLANGQQTDSSYNKLFKPVNSEAGFRWGQGSFLNFFNNNFKYPNTDNNYSGKITIVFSIEKGGNLSDIHVFPNLSPELFTEVERVMKLGKWSPSIQEGRPQRVTRKVVVYIKPETN